MWEDEEGSRVLKFLEISLFERKTQLDNFFNIFQKFAYYIIILNQKLKLEILMVINYAVIQRS